MKYKKRSIKKKRQQRHHFSKKYVQHGGGFMDVIAEINAMEGRTNTCMALHPIEPLVVVGDDSGTLMVWEINDSNKVPPKKLAQFVGLPNAVKCVEFHKTFPLVAGACNDRVLMWRFDQISREQQQQEGVVQQLEPSHTVSLLGWRSQEEVEQELRETEQNIKENEGEEKYQEIRAQLRIVYKNIDVIQSSIDKMNEQLGASKRLLGHYEWKRNLEGIEMMTKKIADQEPQLKEQEQQLELMMKEKIRLEQLSSDIFTNNFNKKMVIDKLKSELEMIRIEARDEVSCIAFYPLSDQFHLKKNTSYIAVSVNNQKNVLDNRITMYSFEIEPSPVKKLYRFSTTGVLLMSFSDNGKLFAFVTNSSVLNVRNFKGADSYFYSSESYSDSLLDPKVHRKKRTMTCIIPYKSSYEPFITPYRGGIARYYQFFIGYDDGSLMLIKAMTETNNGMAAVTKVQELTKMKEWNTGKAIDSVSIHPSLPLFVSCSDNTVQLWGMNSPKSLDPLESFDLQPGLVPVRSVEFNKNFLAVCGPGNVRVYSCNPDDYGVFNERLQKELQSGQIVAEFGSELALANRQGDICPICNEPMNDPLTQPLLSHGPEDAVEGYLTCGHKFHKKCIEPWLAQAKTCPSCRTPGSLVQATPQRIVQGRQDLQRERGIERARSVGETIKNRYKRVLDFDRGAAAAAAVPVAPTVLTPEELRAARNAYFKKQQSEDSGGGKNNKYSRKKNTSKKIKFRRRY